MSFIKHISCPKCGSSDGNGLYKSGSTWCFVCCSLGGARISPYIIEEEPPVSMALPDDCEHDFPKHVLDWVFQYDLTVEELIRHDVFYSKQRNQLIYTWWEDKPPGAPPSGKEPILWQARNFSPSAKAKCYTKGKPEECIPVYSGSKMPGQVHIYKSILGKTFQVGSRRIFAIVEDPISAIKIARQVVSMPILGSDLSMKKIKRIADSMGSLGVESVVVWLDSNMYHKAQRIADRFRLLGVNARAVFTELDPKCYDYQTIKELL